MNKFFTLLLIIASTFSVKSQVNQMISDSAYFVMEVDLGKVVKSVPLEEINKLEFVRFLMKEFENKSSSINNLSDLGIDFSSKLIVFNLEKDAYSSVSAIIPLKDKQKFLTLLSLEEQRMLAEKGSIEHQGKVISVTNQTCIINVIDWKMSYFREKTRIFFEDNDWELPDNYYWFSNYDYIEDDIYDVEEAADAVEEYEDYEEITIDEGEETIEVEVYDDEAEEYYAEEEIISSEEIKERELENKFRRIMDSLTVLEKERVVTYHSNFIKQPGQNLYAKDDLYKKVSNEAADAKIYLNPLMNNSMMNDLMYYPLQNYLEYELENLRQFAFFNFTSDGINMDWKIQVSDDLAEVMKEASSQKIDKKLLKYIPDYAQGIALYNVNAFGAYTKFKEIYMPKLDESEDPYMLMASAVWSTIDEFVDVEAVSSVYPPKVLASYAGFKEVEMTRVSYEYDEETFEYTEMDTTYMEKIPMITLALSNERAYLIEKYMKAIMKLEEDMVIKKDKYYTILEGPWELGIAYHLAVIDDVIILTNDESVVKDHLNGFSGKAFDRKINKKVKKAKMFYAHMDFNQVSKDLIDLGFINNTENFMKLFSDKTGTVDIEMAGISKNQAHYKMKVNTNDNYENGGYFLFELMNAVYLFNK
ncbi:hypothetical protein [Brumimicrobium mesophilum]|uniref:hypothetical protein n=1 Tax=Brumimicrobium mesophilum TaxID=392717 RepID=UPI000D1444B6|nr:hypothetical protein [Brumimicrobium mesophilum]